MLIEFIPIGRMKNMKESKIEMPLLRDDLMNIRYLKKNDARKMEK